MADDNDAEKKFVQALADADARRNPNNEQGFWDEIQPGLRHRVNNQGRTFYVVYEFEGAHPHLKIGKFPEMSLDEARHKAAEVISLAKSGIDPWPRKKLN